jgi:sodium-dependent phosphate cotransporter
LIWLVKELIIGRTKNTVNQALFGNRWKALGWGFGTTALVQSSSVTTSLVVPLVATGKVSLEKVFPFIIGANVGTTSTALITAWVAADLNPQAGLAIALTHLLFNLYGTLIFFPIPKVRDWPVKLASALGAATYRNRLVGILYVVVVFFLLPFSLILVNRGTSPPKAIPTQQEWVQPAQEISPR